MWAGPYGDRGSRKYLIASIDQSLKRMHVDYVDVFYHHRPDPDTPIEETMGPWTRSSGAGRPCTPASAITMTRTRQSAPSGNCAGWVPPA